LADPTLIILGGYGNTGRALSRLMLEHSQVRLVLAGRNEARALAEAAALNERFAGHRARGIAADASDRKSLLCAFEGANLVVAASSTSPVVTTMAEAALEAGLDYLDPQFSRAKVAALQKMAPRIQAAGRCFITDAGFHPGLPAALVRYAAARFDRLQTANVGSVIRIDWRTLDVSPATIDELVTEFRDYQSLHYKDGRWRPMGWVESFRPVWMTFGHGFGRRYTMPMFLEELRPLPKLIPGLEETGFFVGGFNGFVDWVLMPLGMAWMAVSPKAGARAFGRLLLWGLRTFSAPPYGTLLMLEAQGMVAGAPVSMRVTVFHPDGYLLTAAPMAACLLQMLDGSARRPGLHLQAVAVDPQRMLDDLQRMGVSVEVWGPAPPPLPAP
jgi:saccharopine dehydrogenase (NAD+, L-lysine-forming)